MFWGVESKKEVIPSSFTRANDWERKFSEELVIVVVLVDVSEDEDGDGGDDEEDDERLIVTGKAGDPIVKILFEEVDTSLTKVEVEDDGIAKPVTKLLLLLHELVKVEDGKLSWELVSPVTTVSGDCWVISAATNLHWRACNCWLERDGSKKGIDWLIWMFVDCAVWFEWTWV